VLHIPHVSPAMVEVLSAARDVDGRWFVFASTGDVTRRWAVGSGGPPDVVYPSRERCSPVRVVAPAVGNLLVGASLSEV